MHWIPIAAWIAAAAIAVVVMGFCAYEIAWKSKRLRSDVGELLSLSGQLTDLQGSIAVVSQRVAVAAAELR